MHWSKIQISIYLLESVNLLLERQPKSSWPIWILDPGFNAMDNTEIGSWKCQLCMCSVKFTPCEREKFTQKIWYKTIKHSLYFQSPAAPAGPPSDIFPLWDVFAPGSPSSILPTPTPLLCQFQKCVQFFWKQFHVFIQIFWTHFLNSLKVEGVNKTLQELQILSHLTLYWRVTIHVEIVVLNCQKCNQCLFSQFNISEQFGILLKCYI